MIDGHVVLIEDDANSFVSIHFQYVILYTNNIYSDDVLKKVY